MGQILLAGVAGLEPTHARVKVWCLTDLATPQCFLGLAHLGGFEPPAHGLEVHCSILLSYRCIFQWLEHILYSFFIFVIFSYEVQRVSLS